MPLPQPEDVEAAAADAQQLANSIRESGGSLEPVFQRLDIAIREIEEAGYEATDLLPAAAEPGLGFSLRQRRDGKTLWAAIARSGRERLCDPSSEERKRLSGAATQAGAGSLITAILTTLGLPVVAIPVAVAIAAVILAIGISGFCDWIVASPDEPRSP